MSEENAEMSVGGYRPDWQLNYAKIPGIYTARLRGTPDDKGNRRDYGVFVREYGTNENKFELFDNGKLAGCGTLAVGHNCAVAICRHMLMSVACYREHVRRNRSNRKVRNLTPVNPPFYTPASIMEAVKDAFGDKEESK